MYTFFFGFLFLSLLVILQVSAKCPIGKEIIEKLKYIIVHTHCENVILNGAVETILNRIDILCYLR